MKSVFVVVVQNYWGKGETLQAAALACRKAGGGTKDAVLARLYIGDSANDLGAVTVNTFGDIEYNKELLSVPLFAPTNSKIKLGQLI